jgi:hypothetical protein
MAASNVSVVNWYDDSVVGEASMTKEATGLRRNGGLGCGALLLFTIMMSDNASAQAGDAKKITAAYCSSRCVQTVDAYG